MQFPVPQFTDVEDKIIAGLSFKQFGIVFAAAVITFVFYTLTSSIVVTIVTGIITGIPSLALVFGRLNGRPLYSSAGNFVKYLFGAKVYVFHKEGQIAANNGTDISIEESSEPVDTTKRVVKLKELNFILTQQVSEEQQLLSRIAENKKAIS